MLDGSKEHGAGLFCCLGLGVSVFRQFGVELLGVGFWGVWLFFGGGGVVVGVFGVLSVISPALGCLRNLKTN